MPNFVKLDESKLLKLKVNELTVCVSMKLMVRPSITTVLSVTTKKGLDA